MFISIVSLEHSLAHLLTDGLRLPPVQGRITAIETAWLKPSMLAILSAPCTDGKDSLQVWAGHQYSHFLANGYVPIQPTLQPGSARSTPFSLLVILLSRSALWSSSV